MSESNPVLLYLSEVLGVPHILKPDSLGSEPSTLPQEVSPYLLFGNQSRAWVLWVEVQPGAIELELLRRMMEAVGQDSYWVVWGGFENWKPDLLEGQSLGLKFFQGKPSQEVDFFVEVPPLTSMLSGQTDEIQRNKKRVWDELKKLKEVDKP